MSRISGFARNISGGVSVSALLIATSLVALSIAPVVAQTRDSISFKCHTALKSFRTWRTVPRWGEVSVARRVARDSQPYSVGHEVYSDDYGGFWPSESREADGNDPQYQAADLKGN